MKRTLLLNLFIACLQVSATSQSVFGVKAGVNYSMQQKAYLTPPFFAEYQGRKSDPLFGYMVGGFAKTKLHGHFFFAPEINFLTTGCKVAYMTEDMLMNPNATARYFNEKMAYLEFPLLFIYKTKRLYIGGGPAVSLLLFSKWIDFESLSTRTYYYKTIDVAANAVAGFRITKKIDLNIRYSHGLHDIEDGIFLTKNRLLNCALLYQIK